MSYISFEDVPKADSNNQPYILRYEGSLPIVKFRTDNGVEVPLIPHLTKPWFRVEDGGGDCVYGRWKNLQGVDPEAIQKTGKIISIVTNDGAEISTLDIIRPPASDVEPGNVMSLSVADFGTFFGTLLRSAMEGHPNPKAVALEAIAPDVPKRKIPAVAKPGKHLH